MERLLFPEGVDKTVIPLLGSAFATLAVGAYGYRFHHSRLLRGAALLMAVTGFAFASQSSFWPLLLIAFVGTLNPSSGDVSVFLPLEQARLAEASQGSSRTALFARYSLLGALFAAMGALAAGVPDWLESAWGIVHLTAFRIWKWLHQENELPQQASPPSRKVLLQLSAQQSAERCLRQAGLPLP
jgi:hypothetical protein